MNEFPSAKQPASIEEHFRDALVSANRAGNRDLAMQYARSLLAEFPGSKTYRFLRKCAQGEETLTAGFRPFRIALLSSFSIEFLQDALIAQGLASGLRVEIYQGGFATFQQEILDPASGLYGSRPDLVVLAVEGEDWLPDAYGRYSLADPNHSVHKENFKKEIGGLLRQFRNHSQAPILIHDFARPMDYQLGIADGGYQQGQGRLIREINDSLHEVCSRFVDAHVLRYGDLVSRIGGDHWYDLRLKLYARFPLSQSAVGELTREYLKYCRALAGLSRKCLVLDLDNTLWGGVVGEEGIDGIQLGPNYPGNAFVEFQRSILGLRSRGVILALASKNNPQDVEEVFAKHPYMQLKRGDFAATEIHWEPKSESLRRIASQLNIGLDHIVFADDNPAECEHVRKQLPMVTVMQLPTRPELYSKTLFTDGWFDGLTISTEDMQRSALYEQRAQAEVLRESSTDLEGFYRDLDMTLTFTPVNAKNLPRAAQLTQKTNQFNATTRRYSPGEIANNMVDPPWIQVVVSVTDRFGDNGIVGLMMARLEYGTLAIDTFLLSCRVIGRTVETAMLAYLCEAADSMGAESLLGEIIPTPKNTPVRDVFKSHGFAQESSNDSETSVWRLDIDTNRIVYPTWFTIKIENIPVHS